MGRFIGHAAREVLEFITDDLRTAAVVIIWIAAFAGIIRYTPIHGTILSIVFLIGMLLCLMLSVWRRTRA